MKVPISWLKDFVDINIPIDKLSERITLAGLEVGGIDYIGVEGADLEWPRDKLVLGHILKVEQHPNADKLLRMDIDLGFEERQILAGVRGHVAPGPLLARPVRGPR